MSDDNGMEAALAHNGLERKGVLDTDAIKNLMGKSRARNAYGPKLMIFVESDDAAIDPAVVWPVEFAEKKDSTLYQGFNTAIKKAELEGIVKAMASDGKVYLMHLERCGMTVAEADELDETVSDEDIEQDETPELGVEFEQVEA